jgi:hypothetical protein
VKNKIIGLIKGEKMKPQIDWNEKYIIDYLPQIGEQDWIELKRADSLDFSESKHRETLAKEVSAMANSGGGYIVIGLDNTTKKVFNGGVEKKIKNDTKEWIENLIPGLTEPPIKKFNVHIIDGKSGESPIEKGKAIFVIDIEDSEQAPHQSEVNKIYYIRSGSHSIPASDQFVRDIMGRVKSPRVGLSFHYAHINPHNPNRHLRQGEKPILVAEISNVGNIYIQYLNIILFIPKYLFKGLPVYEDNETHTIHGIYYIKIVRENINNEIWSREGEIIGREPGRYTPLLPGRTHSFAIHFGDDIQNQVLFPSFGKQSITYEVFADNMMPLKGEVKFSDIQTNMKLPYE